MGADVRRITQKDLGSTRSDVGVGGRPELRRELARLQGPRELLAVWDGAGTVRLIQSLDQHRSTHTFSGLGWASSVTELTEQPLQHAKTAQ